MSNTEPLPLINQEKALAAKEMLFSFFSNSSNGEHLHQTLNISLRLPVAVCNSKMSGIKEK